MKTLTENIKTFSYGTEPLVNPIEDVNLKPEKTGNSWFWVGHFDSKGHTLNFMYHVSVLQFSKYLPVKMINSVLSITDETGKIYCHEDRFYEEMPKSMIYIVAAEDDKDSIIDIIIESAQSGEGGNAGDGRIFVSPITESYTISSSSKD